MLKYAPTTTAVQAFLLCGGQSRRMGTDKAKLTYGGESFEQRIKQVALKSGVKHLYTVGGASRDIVDERPHHGPAAASIAAMNERCNDENLLHADILLLLPVDMPLLSVSVLRHLIDTTRDHQQSRYFNRDWFPLAIYQPYRYLKALNQLLAGNPMPAMKSFAKVCEAQTLSLPTALHHQLMNVNTPVEFTALTGNEEYSPRADTKKADTLNVSAC